MNLAADGRDSYQINVNQQDCKCPDWLHCASTDVPVVVKSDSQFAVTVTQYEQGIRLLVVHVRDTSEVSTVVTYRVVM